MKKFSSEHWGLNKLHELNFNLASHKWKKKAHTQKDLQPQNNNAWFLDVWKMQNPVLGTYVLYILHW